MSRVHKERFTRLAVEPRNARRSGYRENSQRPSSEFSQGF